MLLDYNLWLCGVVVSTLDSESGDLGLNPSTTFLEHEKLMLRALLLVPCWFVRVLLALFHQHSIQNRSTCSTARFSVGEFFFLQWRDKRR